MSERLPDCPRGNTDRSGCEFVARDDMTLHGCGVDGENIAAELLVLISQPDPNKAEDDDFCTSCGIERNGKKYNKDFEMALEILQGLEQE